MEFTFTDYTFSGLLSILAALFGVGYPLIIQSIEGISRQYSSIHITERFSKEPVYRVFQLLLVSNLFFAITVPFLLHSGWNNLLFITLQAIFLFLLIGVTLMLFNLILEYSSGPKLLQRLEGTRIDKQNVFHILDLAIYADANHIYSLYSDCLKDVFRYISVQQGDERGQSFSTVLPPVIYDHETIQIVDCIRSYIREEGGHLFLHRQNDLVSIIFNQFSKSRISRQGLQMMWRSSNDAISYGNKLWFSQYWQFADSYANIKYHFIPAGCDELKQDKEEFVLQHVMLGASIIHSKRYQWLGDIFYYTHSEPEYYGLIPSTFSHIIAVLRRLSEIYNEPTFGGRYFYFNDSMGGATDEQHIFNEAIRYLALLIMRLWAIKDRNLMDDYVLDTPIPEENILNEKKEIENLLMLNTKVIEWSKQKAVLTLLKLSDVPIDDITKYINTFVSFCQKDIDTKQKHPLVSLNKLDSLYKDVNNAIASIWVILPLFSEQSSWAQEIDYLGNVEFSRPIDTLEYSLHLDMGNISTGNALMGEEFMRCLCAKYYNSVLISLRCIQRLFVYEGQVSSLFDIIGYSDRFISIATDDIIGIPSGCTNLSLFRSLREIIILPKEDLPLIEFIPIYGESKDRLSPNGCYYSNIQELSSYQERSFDLRIFTQILVHMNRSCRGYIRVTIIDSSCIDEERSLDVKLSLESIYGES